MYKVCIISCGMIANSAHIPAYKMFDEFQITGVFDISEKAARETAEKHNIPNWYTSCEEMLEKEKPDLVSVCVPNCFHKEYTILALNAGANVLCEKPLAVTEKDAIEMFDTAKKNGKTLMACQSMRFTPDRLAAKKAIDEGKLGDVYYGELSRTRRRGIPTWGTFHMNKISCGGALIDIGVHMIDAAVWLMGNPKIKSVYGTTMQNHKYELGSLKGSGAFTGEVSNARLFDPEEMDVEDFACGILDFENGSKLSFKVAWAANMEDTSDIRLIGKNAGVKLPSCEVYFGEDGNDKLEPIPLKYDSAFPGHIYIIENFLHVLKGEAKPFVKPEESINVSKILELFYKSAKGES